MSANNKNENFENNSLKRVFSSLWCLEFNSITDALCANQD